MTTTAPTGDNSLLQEALPDREIGWVERFLGPDNYRVVQGLLKTPASILGFILIGLFILIAIFAPALAPPVTSDRAAADGFALDAQCTACTLLVQTADGQ